MKLIKHTINWIVWSLMALYILLLITTHIPGCQRFFGGLVADAVLVTVHHVDGLLFHTPGHTTIVGNAGALAAATLLGGNDDDTV